MYTPCTYEELRSCARRWSCATLSLSLRSTVMHLFQERMDELREEMAFLRDEMEERLKPLEEREEETPRQARPRNIPQESSKILRLVLYVHNGDLD